MKKLTARQQQVLDCIRQFMRKHQCPPTRRELMSLLGWSSPNAAQKHIATLMKKGHLAGLTSLGASRGLIVPHGECPYCGARRHLGKHA